VGAAVADERSKVLDRATAAVLDGDILGACSVELDRGESGDLLGDVVGGGVNLGNGNVVGEWDEEASELIVLGGETGIVSAGSTKLMNAALLTPCSVHTMVHSIQQGHPSRC